MTTQLDAPLLIAGIGIRTTNRDGRGAKEMGDLWNRFLSNNIAASIPDRADERVYAVYTDYESDYMGEYTALLGCQVQSTDRLPAELMYRSVPAGTYSVIEAKGSLYKGAVTEAWKCIWGLDLDRVYTTDFEIYDHRAADPEHAVVDIFVAVRL